ncbi:low molecular weight phosphotyrosine protein phosphatase [Candidatus Sumerlaeota bacterium]|nr:low molecular weight phosphotyrosine protein phosphatase [Candidatus Sumerlaeota bacterium]
MSQHKKLLFVCLGNICRSPAAEGTMKRLVEQAGRQDEFFIDSAGTGRWHVGELPDERMQRAAAARGLLLDSRGRQIKAQDLESFDLILAMDSENYRNILDLDRTGKYHDKVKMMLSYLDGDGPKDVPDPYYGGSDGFDRVLDLLEKACSRLLASFDEK